MKGDLGRVSYRVTQSKAAPSHAPMLAVSDITHPEYGIDTKSLLTSPLSEDEQLGAAVNLL
jgi:hypothetical protein